VVGKTGIANRGGVFEIAVEREELMERGYIRLGLLQDMWLEDHAVSVWHFRRAMSSLDPTVKRHAEHHGDLFVYAPAEEQRAESKGA
jgi:hypothetical protein